MFPCARKMVVESAVDNATPKSRGTNSAILKNNSKSGPANVSNNTSTIATNVYTANLADIVARWTEVVTKLRDYNHSLSFILSIAKPVSLVDNTLTISFQYKLHQERVNDAKVRGVIEQTLKDVLAVPIKIKGIVEQVENVGGDLLSSVLSTFGGQVVEESS